MKKTLILAGVFLSAIIIVACKDPKLREHYSGFVVDETGKPIS